MQKYTPPLTFPDRVNNLFYAPTIFLYKAGSWQKSLQMAKIKKLFRKKQAKDVNTFRNYK